MDQLLRRIAGSIQVQFEDSTGALVDSTPQTPPCTVTDGSGTVITSGNATRVSQGVYSFALTPAQLANLDILTATFTPAGLGTNATYVAEAEVVGAQYFTIADLRSFGQGLGSATAYPTPTLLDIRAQVMDRFEEECGVSFVPRGRRITVDGDGSQDLRLPNVFLRRIVEIKIDGLAISAGDLASVRTYQESGWIHYTNGVFAREWRNVQVWYEHGYDQPPWQIKRAALEYAKVLALKTNEDERQVNAANDVDTRSPVTMNYPSRWRPTGISRIDSVLWRWNQRIPGMA